MLIWFGVNPAPLLDMIQRNAVPSMAELLTPESEKLRQHIGSEPSTHGQLRRSSLALTLRHIWTVAANRLKRRCKIDPLNWVWAGDDSHAWTADGWLSLNEAQFLPAGRDRLSDGVTATHGFPFPRLLRPQGEQA